MKVNHTGRKTTGKSRKKNITMEKIEGQTRRKNRTEDAPSTSFEADILSNDDNDLIKMIKNLQPGEVINIHG